MPAHKKPSAKNKVTDTSAARVLEVSPSDYDKLTRQEIAERLCDELGSHKEAKDFTNGFFEVLAKAVAENPKIKVSQFGVFSCIDKKARVGRNPRTGETAPISARRVVKFMPSQHFRGKMWEDDDS